MGRRGRRNGPQISLSELCWRGSGACCVYAWLDTACQPKHYREDLVGAALKSLAADHGISREELWVQTKFTPITGQDLNDVPYDPSAPLSKQVQQSLERSFSNLGVDYINSLVLHSPLQTGEQTLAVWQVLEEAVDEGRIGQIGISNLYDYEHFVWLHGATRHKPKVLQNRFYRDAGFDKELRAFCLDNNITYQTFWTLTANPHILSSDTVGQIRSRLQEATGAEVTPPQVLFKFLIQSGHQPLTGTTSDVHMKEDLASPGLPDLSTEEMAAISGLLV